MLKFESIKSFIENLNLQGKINCLEVIGKIMFVELFPYTCGKAKAGTDTVSFSKDHLCPLKSVFPDNLLPHSFPLCRVQNGIGGDHTGSLHYTISLVWFLQGQLRECFRKAQLFKYQQIRGISELPNPQQYLWVQLPQLYLKMFKDLCF